VFILLFWLKFNLWSSILHRYYFMDRSAEFDPEGVWRKPDEGTEEEDDSWGTAWPPPAPVQAPHVGASPCPVVPCPFCILGVLHESSLAMVKDQWAMTLQRYHEHGDSWHSIFIQSLAFSWICQRVELLLQEPEIPWRSVRHVNPNDPLHDQTTILMNQHVEAPPGLETTDERYPLTLPPPPPPQPPSRMAPWHAVGASDSSAGTGWRPRTLVEPVPAALAALPDKVFEYECSGGESKKKKYRAYEDEHQQVLWEAYRRNAEGVSITVDGEFTYSVFFAPRWVQRSHDTGYERAVRLKDC
jgi:hypothetical protein